MFRYLIVLLLILYWPISGVVVVRSGVVYSYDGLDFEAAVDLGSTDEIIFRQTTNTVSAVCNLACVVADIHIRMMVLLVCDCRYNINESHCFIIISEFERAAD